MLDNLWEKIDDASWKLAAGLHLDSILERYNLPPIILPIAIIVVIIALLLLLSAPASYPSVSGPCGDGSCDATKGEDIISCPADCAPRSTGGRSVTVELIGDVRGEVRVTLYDSDANEIESLEGSKSTYTFPNVNAQRVKVIVLNTKNMEHVSSDFVNLDSATITIPLVLPRGFFDEQVAPPKASILVSVRDAITGSPIPARVSILVSQSGYFSVITSEDIDGLGSFQVDSNQWYSIVAEADNYRTYDTKNNPIQIAAGDERTIEALLEPLTEQQLTQPSQVQVCVVDEAGVYVAGNVDVQTLGGL